MRTPIPLFGGSVLDQLREVGLIGVHVDWKRSSLRGLSVLELKYLAEDIVPSLQEFTDLLHSSPNLRQLTIIGRGPDIPASDLFALAPPQEPDSKVSLQTIHLRHLMRFTLGFTDVDYSLRLLSLFSMPNVTELVLQGFSVDHDLLDNSHPDATRLLLRLAAGSASTPESPSRGRTPARSHHPTPIPLSRIHSLTLDAICASEAAFSQFFDQFKKLQRLFIASADENVLRALGLPLDCIDLQASPLYDIERAGVQWHQVCCFCRHHQKSRTRDPVKWESIMTPRDGSE